MLKTTSQLIVGILSLFVTSTALAANRADIVAYSDGIPSLTLGGALFAPPVPSCERVPSPGNCGGQTRTFLDHESVSGMQHPVGAVGWGLATFGKYVLLGNYEQGSSGTALIGPPISPLLDQQIGVFNTEENTFCVLDLDPANLVQGGVEWLATATPESRQSRIYFQGFPAQGGNNGAVVGYLEADLDNDDPCDPTTGWQVETYSPGELLSATPAIFLPDMAPCLTPAGNDFCGFDGMQILSHDSGSNTDTLVLNNWWSQRIVLLEVAPSGPSVVDVYPTDGVWQPEGSGTPCMALRPVIKPAVDPTRAPGDLRFAVGYDQFCDIFLPPASGCAASQPFCPSSGTACTLGQACPGSVCTVGYKDCATNADCGAYNGTCSNACLSIHPGTKCSGSGTPCARGSNCPVDEDCVCGPGRPLQEFKYDGNMVSSTSARFQVAASHQQATLGMYDSIGGLWVADNPYDDTAPPESLDDTHVAVYGATAGEHVYDNLMDPTGNEIHPPSTSMIFERTRWYDRPAHSVQVGNAVYTVGTNTLQRATLASGDWSPDSTYRAYLGSDVLPSASPKCQGGSTPRHLCKSDTDCPGGTCVNTSGAEAVDDTWKRDLVPGGSPPSLWTAPVFTDQTRSFDLNTWLLRVPVAVQVPDSISAVPPAIIWTTSSACGGTACTRLWMIGEHGGSLKYRVRDDAIWSGWHPLPTNIVAVGGASGLQFNGSVELFARSAAGTVITTKLTSALDCAPGACSWSAWSSIPGSPITNVEPAAAVQDFGANQGPFLAVRRSSDGRIQYARRSAGVWSTWRTTGNRVEPVGAPAVVSNPNDLSGRMWIVATRPADGEVHWARVTDGLTFGAWTAATSRPVGVSAWGASPQVVRDGSRIRIFVPEAASPHSVWQLTHDGQDWDSWAKIFSGGSSNLQPSAAVLGPNTELLTYTSGIGAFSQFVR